MDSADGFFVSRIRLHFSRVCTIKARGVSHIGELLFSVPIFRRMIFVTRLDAVMSVAERLPVALIPEQNAVTAVRFDVVDIGRLDVTSCLQALYTQRMPLK